MRSVRFMWRGNCLFKFKGINYGRVKTVQIL